MLTAMEVIDRELQRLHTELDDLDPDYQPYTDVLEEISRVNATVLKLAEQEQARNHPLAEHFKGKDHEQVANGK
jgi:hypothetical protein